MIPARVRPGRPVIVAVVAATALVSGAGVAFAASSWSSGPTPAAKARAAAATSPPSASPTRCKLKLPRGFPLPGRIFAAPGPFVPFGFAPFGAIHGQFVAPKPGGGYQTIDAQRGTVTAVSSSSITIKSSDGYTKTYQVTSSTHVDGPFIPFTPDPNAQRAGIGSVKTGQTVSVLATVHGSSATATWIVDLAALAKIHEFPPKLPAFLKPGSRHMFRIGPCVAHPLIWPAP